MRGVGVGVGEGVRVRITIGVSPPRLDLPGHQGLTLELCAGIVDKEGKSLGEVAREEVRLLLLPPHLPPHFGPKHMGSGVLKFNEC